MKILKKITPLVIFGISTFLTTGCSLPTDPGPQPKEIIDTKFEPGYNVLGVLRNEGNPGSSFIRVEELYKLSDIDEEYNPAQEGLDVRILEVLTGDTLTFVETDDSLRGLIYSDSSFRPLAATRYSLSISGGDLSAVTADVIVPPSPVIDTNSVTISGKTVQFYLDTVSEIALYEVYLTCENDTISVRQFPAQSGKTIIRISVTSATGPPEQLEIYGYESNLAEYITAPITIKPQTYRETVTTVSGGYGVFGAVSVSTYQFQ